MRVLIVDDSAFMRRALSQMIASDPSLHVVGTACNGQEALEKARTLRPDVITMDIEMPVMDGLTALRRMRMELPEPRPAVLVCSSLTSRGSHEALAALRAGAADVIAKEGSQFSLHVGAMRDELVAKIKAVGGARSRGTVTAAPVPRLLPSVHPGQFDVVLIGSSTGGPPVLEQILTALPADFPVPVVIAQHMPPLFTKSLAERLDELCAITVMHGSAGLPLHPGTAYIGEGGKHVRILRSALGRYALEISDRPVDALYKPSVNELLSSGARYSGPRCLGIVLTGMGEDGRVGAQDLHAKGGLILTQDMESCVVYGMPRAVNEAGVAAASLPPTEIIRVLRMLGGARGASEPAAA